MKNKLAILILSILSYEISAQNDTAETKIRINAIEKQLIQFQGELNSANENIQSLRNDNNVLKGDISSIKGQNVELSSQIDSLSALLKASQREVDNLNNQLTEQKIEFSGQIIETKETTKQSISQLDKTLNKNTLYWIIAVLTVGLLSLLAFFLLRKQVTDNQSSITESLAKTRRELEQEAIKLDEKLVGVMETQLKLIREERKEKPESQNGEQDHSLALKVADEIVRIEKNISQMDEGTRGLKQLAMAVARIRDNFASNGYEMVDMLNKPYEEGLKASVTFRPDSDLNGDQPKITRIIKPQVNYKGLMIQQAQIEVSQPE